MGTPVAFSGRLIPGIAEKLFDGVIRFIMSKLRIRPASDSGGGGGEMLNTTNPLVEHILESRPTKIPGQTACFAA